MPKLRKRDGKRDKMRETLEGRRAVLGLTYEEIAAKMNVSRCTVATRFRNPEQFTLNELLILAIVFDVSLASVLSAAPER